MIGTQSDSSLESQSSAAKTAKIQTRKGKWTVEEENFANAIVHYHQQGMLDLPMGTTLRSHVANSLKCDPMRITKKFMGRERLGKKLCKDNEACLQHRTVARENAKSHLQVLERHFQVRHLNLGEHTGGASEPNCVWSEQSSEERERLCSRNPLAAAEAAAGGSSLALPMHAHPVLSTVPHEQPFPRGASGPGGVPAGAHLYDYNREGYRNASTPSSSLSSTSSLAHSPPSSFSSSLSLASNRSSSEHFLAKSLGSSNIGGGVGGGGGLLLHGPGGFPSQSRRGASLYYRQQQQQQLWQQQKQYTHEQRQQQQNEQQQQKEKPQAETLLPSSCANHVVDLESARQVVGRKVCRQGMEGGAAGLESKGKQTAVVAGVYLHDGRGGGGSVRSFHRPPDQRDGESHWAEFVDMMDDLPSQGEEEECELTDPCFLTSERATQGGVESRRCADGGRRIAEEASVFATASTVTTKSSAEKESATGYKGGGGSCGGDGGGASASGGIEDEPPALQATAGSCVSQSGDRMARWYAAQLIASAGHYSFLRQQGNDAAAAPAIPSPAPDAASLPPVPTSTPAFAVAAASANEMVQTKVMRLKPPARHNPFLHSAAHAPATPHSSTPFPQSLVHQRQCHPHWHFEGPRASEKDCPSTSAVSQSLKSLVGHVGGEAAKARENVAEAAEMGSEATAVLCSPDKPQVPSPSFSSPFSLSRREEDLKASVMYAQKYDGGDATTTAAAAAAITANNSEIESYEGSGLGASSSMKRANDSGSSTSAQLKRREITDLRENANFT